MPLAESEAPANGLPAVARIATSAAERSSFTASGIADMDTILTTGYRQNKN